jgi:hypothetical protein
MYSLSGCFNDTDVNSREWLIDVLTRIPKNNQDYSLDLADLLKHNCESSISHQEIPTESGILEIVVTGQTSAVFSIDFKELKKNPT